MILYSMSYRKGLPLYNLSSDERIENLKNPQVEIVSVYSNFITTEAAVIYQENPISKNSSNIPVEPDSYIHTFGDGTVPTASAIVPAIKWANDFDEKKEGAKPVTFIEVCSR